MKRVLILAALLAVAALATGAVALAIDDKDEDELTTFMRRKLVFTQAVLVGITTDNEALIHENAQALAAMPDEKTWKVLETPEYMNLSESFRRAAEGLVSAGDNLDAAGLSYISLATSCFDCHRHVREIRERETQ